MNRSIALRHVPMLMLALVAGAIVAVGVLAAMPAPAHALFTSQHRYETVHEVKAFPVGISVDSSGYAVRAKEIDRDRLAVTVLYSDGSTRELGDDEYALAPAEIPGGFKGDFASEAAYEEAGHRVSVPFTLDANEAYGAQYGDVLVFGRGVPADTYEGKGLANTTWGIEEAGCTPLWDKRAIANIEDIATVRPASLSGWFNGSGSIRTVALEQMDASALTSLDSLFADDASLVSVDMSNWDTSNNTSLRNSFVNCRSLTSIVGIGDIDTSQVTNMSATFRYCTSMVSMDLSAWETGNVRSLNNFCCMAWQANALRTVGDLSGWDTSKVQDFACMFQGATHFEHIGNIGRWNTSSATNMGCIFQYCHPLKSVGDLSGWNVSCVTNFYNAFQYCNSLTTIGDVSRWNTSNVTNMYQMFQWDSSLSVDCSKWNVNKVTEHDNFNGNGANHVTAPRWSS